MSVSLPRQEVKGKVLSLVGKSGSPRVCSGWLDRPYKVLLPFKCQGGKKKPKNIQLNYIF